MALGDPSRDLADLPMDVRLEILGHHQPGPLRRVNIALSLKISLELSSVILGTRLRVFYSVDVVSSSRWFRDARQSCPSSRVTFTVVLLLPNHEVS